MGDKELFWEKRVEKSAVLNPIDRISEVLFGLIMVLTFTGAISVSDDGRQEIRDLLWAALGCNVAWGLVDAIMYLMNVLFERGATLHSIRDLQKMENKSMIRKRLKEGIQPVVSELLTDAEIDRIGEQIKKMPEPGYNVLLSGKDLLSALQIFLLVFLCTLPVALPFGFIDDPGTALRVSNGVALTLLFIGGYKLAGFAGFRKLLTALIYTLIGVVLVAITIALGG